MAALTRPRCPTRSRIRLAQAFGASSPKGSRSRFLAPLRLARNDQSGKLVNEERKQGSMRGRAGRWVPCLANLSEALGRPIEDKADDLQKTKGSDAANLFPSMNWDGQPSNGRGHRFEPSEAWSISPGLGHKKAEELQKTKGFSSADLFPSINWTCCRHAGLQFGTGSRMIEHLTDRSKAKVLGKREVDRTGCRPS
jgi:hypothetical protein